MPYQVLDTAGIDEQSGLTRTHTTFAERLQSALNRQKSDRGMELVFTAKDEDGETLFVFLHETEVRY